jgi:PAS domain S-box-containing protein
MSKALKTNKHSHNSDIDDLRHKYYLLRDLMDFIPDVIYFKDKKGRFVMVNQAHAKGLGVKPEALVGKSDFDLFSRDRAAKMAQDDAQVLIAGKSIIDKVERATRPDGIDNYVSTTKIPRFDKNGKIIGLIGITRDITKRMQFERLRKDKMSIEKKLESLEELSSMKSEFISMVSHELRTPLAVIKQLVRVIFDGVVGKVNDKQKEVLQKTLDNTDRLKKIIDDLLDVSRIERNTLKLHYSLVDIADLIKDSAAFFNKLASEKDITLKYHYPKEPVNVFIDADRVNQVISNLITNAIKFTGEGGRINVEVKVLESKVRIGVLDTGIGISKADLALVFNKFTQVSKLPSVENKGVGLGLSISKHLVERHKGEIWVESKLGVGSKFYFTLPRFYTLDMLGKKFKDKVSSLMKRGISMHFVSLSILSYPEFKRRLKIKGDSLFEDLRLILDATFKDVKLDIVKKHAIIAMDQKLGKLSVVLPQVSCNQALKVANLLKQKIRHYFNLHKVENVFVTIGKLSYHQNICLSGDSVSGGHFSVNEIYIGSEMRRFKRIALKTAVKLNLTADKEEPAESVDISEGGICITTGVLLKTDSQLKLRFNFPQQKGREISSRAWVAWIRKIDEPHGVSAVRYKVGLEFIKLDDSYKRAIRKQLREAS